MAIFSAMPWYSLICHTLGDADGYLLGDDEGDFEGDFLGLADGDFESNAKGTIIQLPKTAADPLATVVLLDVIGTPAIEPFIATAGANGVIALSASEAHPTATTSLTLTDSIIGHITEEHAGKVIMKSAFGGKRVVNPLIGEQLPRIF